ncbi:MAG TPA: tetratricopeptide repeat protein [Tepidisphaeraceae bacterium]|nr:tetratricopeptide repeat protein [Tepidisphaeraceae bacterium]
MRAVDRRKRANPVERPWARWAFPALIVAAVWGVFWPALGHGFVDWDDPINIRTNPDFHPPALGKIAAYWDWNRPIDEAYIPASRTAWGMLAFVAYDPATGEIDPTLYHALNVLLHSGSALLIYLILQELGAGRWAACGGALLFAIHPLQVEPVAWATGTKDLLSGILALLAMWSYVRYAKVDPARRLRRTLLYAGGFFAFAIALLAKPTIAAVPVMAGAISLLILRRGWRRTFLEMLPWLLAVVPVLIEAARSQPPRAEDHVAPLAFRFIVALDTLSFYFSKFVFPLHLTVDYGRTPTWLMHHPARNFTWIVPVVLGIGAWLARPRAPWLTSGFIIFCAGPAALLGIVPFDFQHISTTADRYIYLGLFGAAIAGAYLLMIFKGRAAIITAAVVLVLLAGRSMAQTVYWENTETLFTHAMELNPSSWTALINVGVVQLHQGKVAEAKSKFERALEVAPDEPEARTNLATLLLKEGKPQAAAEQYEKVLAQQPDNPEAQYDYGNLLLRTGHPADAIPHYLTSFHHLDNVPGPHTNLGIAYAMTGKPDEAIVQLQRSVQLDPSNARVRVQLGDLLAGRNRMPEALDQFEAAVRLDPTLPSARQRYEYLRKLLPASTRP